MNAFEIRAAHDDRTVRVYQAYSPLIALPALEAGRFVPPFKHGRMTWIKPSFNWMMYRCGFASKAGQEHVLAIDITREGFEWALDHAVLSTFHQDLHGTLEQWQRLVEERPVRIQWDPERDPHLRVIPGVRAIQIGLSGEAAERYLDEWIVRITDVTPLAQEIGRAVANGTSLPAVPSDAERPYPMDRIDQAIRS